jgi:hypothetical protein
VSKLISETCAYVSPGGTRCPSAPHVLSEYCFQHNIYEKIAANAPPKIAANAPTIPSTSRSQIDRQLDGMIEELVIIKKYREINASNKMKSILPAIVVTLFVMGLPYLFTRESLSDFTATFDDFLFMFIIFCLPTLYVISIILSIKENSIFKGSLLRAGSLIKSIDEMLMHSPSYSRRAEYIIVKSGFEAAFSVRLILGVIAVISAIIAILLIFVSSHNNRRY